MTRPGVWTPALAEAADIIARARARALHPSSPAPASPLAVERCDPRPAADDAHRGVAGDHHPGKQSARPAATGRAHTNNS